MNQPGQSRRWVHVLAIFFAGVFLANAIPHFTNGVSGRPFPSPFASPPGQGESSSVINVSWGMFNLVVFYVLTFRVGKCDFRRIDHALVFAAGWFLTALGLAAGFGRVYGGS